MSRGFPLLLFAAPCLLAAVLAASAAASSAPAASSSSCCRLRGQSITWAVSQTPGALRKEGKTLLNKPQQSPFEATYSRRRPKARRHYTVPGRSLLLPPSPPCRHHEVSDFCSNCSFHATATLSCCTLHTFSAIQEPLTTLRLLESAQAQNDTASSHPMGPATAVFIHQTCRN